MICDNCYLQPAADENYICKDCEQKYFSKIADTEEQSDQFWEILVIKAKLNSLHSLTEELESMYEKACEMRKQFRIAFRNQLDINAELEKQLAELRAVKPSA